MINPGKLPGISAIIMAYNEAANLESVTRAIGQELARIGVPYEIIVIDDGSRDDTSEVAHRLLVELPNIRITTHPENRGLGGVYRTGFTEAKMDYVTFFPADGQFSATIIGEYYPQMQNSDLVLGHVTNQNHSFIRSFLSASERFFYRMLFGEFPRFSGIMMFRRAILSAVPLVSTGSGWTVVWELILRAQREGFKIRNMPNNLMPRMSGVSKVANLRTACANFFQMLELRRVLNKEA